MLAIDPIKGYPKHTDIEIDDIQSTIDFIYAKANDATKVALEIITAEIAKDITKYFLEEHEYDLNKEVSLSAELQIHYLERLKFDNISYDGCLRAFSLVRALKEKNIGIEKPFIPSGKKHQTINQIIKNYTEENIQSKKPKAVKRKKPKKRKAKSSDEDENEEVKEKRRNFKEVAEAARNATPADKDVFISRFNFKNASEALTWINRRGGLPEVTSFLRSEDGVLGKYGNTQKIIGRFLRDIYKERAGVPFKSLVELISNFNRTESLVRSISERSFKYHVNNLHNRGLITNEIAQFYTQCRQNKMTSALSL